VALSAFWEDFVTDYFADGVFWYFPKGGTADTDDFRERFRIFSEFEGDEWSPLLQGRFLDALHAAKLSVGKTKALVRITKRVYENLGIAWVATGHPIRITPAGREYLKEKGPSKVLDSHVWRYQFPNPLNDIEVTKGISLFPHHVVVEVMLACNNHVTKDEFVLFVARMKRSAEIPKCVERINAWRKAPHATRAEIFQRLQHSKYKTVDDNAGFPMAFHRCDLLLDRRTDQLSVSPENVHDLKAMLELYKGEAEPIEFNDEPDTIAFYGDPDRVPTKLEALDYYMDVSDVEKAVEAYRKLPEDVRGEQTPEEFEKEQFLEKHLEEYLEKHLDKIEAGLKIIGRQHKTEVGPIDLYARATDGALVVIELKKGRAADKVFGQICRYIGCIKEDHAEEDENVRGYTVGRQVDDKLKYATKAVPPGLVTLQVFDFKGDKGKEDWIQVAAA
jgi:hypothetical protein